MNNNIDRATMKSIDENFEPLLDEEKPFVLVGAELFIESVNNTVFYGMIDFDVDNSVFIISGNNTIYPNSFQSNDSKIELKELEKILEEEKQESLKNTFLKVEAQVIKTFIAQKGDFYFLCPESNQGKIGYLQ